MPTIHKLLFGALALLNVSSSFADDQLARDKQALAPLQAYVGQWRGVAQPKRGSSQGAYTEEVDWQWQFPAGRAELVAQLRDDKYFAKLRLRAADEPNHFELIAEPAAKTPGGEKPAEPVTFAGEVAGEALVLTSSAAAADAPARISVRLVAAGDRMLILYEKKAGVDLFARLAELGATRKGSSFAKAVASGPECVVTGGLGTIGVEHDGQKYFVCCGGCRDLFLLDPTGVLADYRERKAAEKAEREAGK